MAKVITLQKDRIWLVSINRPENRNAVDRETADLLFDAFEYFDQNDDLDIAILYGSDGVFCAGADLKTIASESELAPRLELHGKAPLGKALDVAIDLAKMLCQLPQRCMRSDHLSALEQWSLNEIDALDNESRRGLEVIKSGETVEGAKRFTNRKFA